MIEALSLYRAVGYENITQAKQLMPVLMGKAGRYSAQFNFDNGEKTLKAVEEISKSLNPENAKELETLRGMFNKYLPRTMAEGTENIVDMLFDVFKSGKTKGQIKTLTMDENGVIGKSKLDVVIGDDGIKIKVNASGENDTKASYDVHIANNNANQSDLVQKKNFLDGLTYEEPVEDVTGRLDFDIKDAGAVKSAKGYIQAPAGYMRETSKKNFGFDIKKDLDLEINQTEVQIKDYQDYQPMLRF